MALPTSGVHPSVGCLSYRPSGPGPASSPRLRGELHWQYVALALGTCAAGETIYASGSGGVCVEPATRHRPRPSLLREPAAAAHHGRPATHPACDTVPTSEPHGVLRCQAVPGVRDGPWDTVQRQPTHPPREGEHRDPPRSTIDGFHLSTRGQVGQEQFIFFFDIASTSITGGLASECACAPLASLTLLLALSLCQSSDRAQ